MPKTYLPNYREFYERRQFTPGTHALSRGVALLGATAPFGNDILYDIASRPECIVHVEICEDVWVPLPPSSYAALAGSRCGMATRQRLSRVNQCQPRCAIETPVQMPRQFGQHDFERRSHMRFDQVPAVRCGVGLADDHVGMDLRRLAIEDNVPDEG